MAAVLRAIYGYAFLVFMVRIIGRRPGKQMMPFEYVLIFFIGGLMLTAMVGSDRSITNALSQIVAVACVHFLISVWRRRSEKFAEIADGNPLMLIQDGKLHHEHLEKMLMSEGEIMVAARQKGLKDLAQVKHAVLERNGSISLIEKPDAA